MKKKNPHTHVIYLSEFISSWLGDIQGHLAWSLSFKKNMCTWRIGFRNRTCILLYHMFWCELSSQIGLRTSLNTYHTSISSHHVFCWNASLFRWDHLMLLRVHGGHTSSQGKHKPSSSPPPCCFSAWASMGDCGHGGAAASSGLSEIPYCRFHIWNGWWPWGTLATVLSLPHLDLILCIFPHIYTEIKL